MIKAKGNRIARRILGLPTGKVTDLKSCWPTLPLAENGKW